MERLYLEYGGRGRLTLLDYQALGRIKGSIEAAVERALSAADADLGRLQRQYLLAKDKKTAHELVNIIGQRIGVGGVMVSVFPDPAFGWSATIITAPSAASGAQAMLEQIVQELRTEFELKT